MSLREKWRVKLTVRNGWSDMSLLFVGMYSVCGSECVYACWNIVYFARLSCPRVFIAASQTLQCDVHSVHVPGCACMTILCVCAGQRRICHLFSVKG